VAQLAHDLRGGVAVGLGTGRESGFDDVHTELGERACHHHLLLWRHAAAGGLLAIAQRGVEDAYEFGVAAHARSSSGRSLRMLLGADFCRGDGASDAGKRPAGSGGCFAAGKGSRSRTRRRGLRGGRGRTSDSRAASTPASTLPPDTTAHSRLPATRLPAASASAPAPSAI